MVGSELQCQDRGSDPPANRNGCAQVYGQGSKQATCSSGWSDMDGKMNQSEDELPGAKEQNSVEAVLAYHRRTKHQVSRYAAGPDGLDWANQPDPFRTFAGAPRVELPLLAEGLSSTYGIILVGSSARR